MHSYLYEPRPSVGRYYLSNNIWRDAFSTAPWATGPHEAVRPERRAGWPKDVGAVLHVHRRHAVRVSDAARRRSTEPAAGQAGRRRRRGDPVHRDAHADGDGLPGRESREVQARRELLHDDPDLEVVVEKHYAWDLPLIVGGVATNNRGRPWGFLASVNDVFKTAQSDED